MSNSKSTRLIITNKGLTTLDGYDLTGITELDCDDNELTDLGVLPEGLITLSCNNNELTDLGILPKGLITLSCNNLLNHLPF